MTKVTAIKLIVRAYFFAAIAGSFTHIIDAAAKTGLHGWEQYATPFMIDGLAIIGLIMRSEDFSKRTRKLGGWTQGIMGSFSLIANVYAAESTGGVMFGVAIVALFLAAEYLSDNIESVTVDQAAAAAAAQAETEAVEAAKRQQRNAAARTRRAAAKTRTSKVSKGASRGPLKAV